MQKTWEVLIADFKLDDYDKNQLFKVMVKYWIKIRCTAYVKVYIDIRQASINKGKQVDHFWQCRKDGGEGPQENL